ncbi:MAG: hypothetical protein ACM359_03825 [Bacillota bacterium]
MSQLERSAALDAGQDALDAGVDYGRAPGVSLRLRVGITAVCLLAFSGLLSWRLPYGAKASADTAAYIECARNVVQGEGFRVGRFAELTADRWEPLQYWPPGYSLLMVPLIGGGVPEILAALIVVIVASVIFVVLVTNVCLTRFPTPIALVLSLVILSMPCFLSCSARGLSEMPYLAMSAVSLLCMARSMPPSIRGAAWMLGAGLAGGIAWCIRNVGVALFVASVAYLACQILWLGFRTAIRNGVYWCIGWCAASAWWLCRNVLIFGQINPYTQPPSERVFIDNLRDALQVILHDVTGIYSARNIVASAPAPWVVLAIGVVTALVLIYWWGPFGLIKRLRKHHDRVLWGVYLIIYCATIIVARTVYRWGEFIGTRHFLPVYWLIWIFLATGGVALAVHLMRSRGTAIGVMTGILILVLLLQTRADVLHVLRLKREDSVRIATINMAHRLEKVVPAGQLLLSDWPEMFRIYGRLDARAFPDTVKREAAITVDEIRQAAHAGLLWGVVITQPKLCIENQYGPAVRQLVLDPASVDQFDREMDKDGILLLRRAER